jgi:hypothetical protein
MCSIKGALRPHSFYLSVICVGIIDGGNFGVHRA